MSGGWSKTDSNYPVSVILEKVTIQTLCTYSLNPVVIYLKLSFLMKVRTFIKDLVYCYCREIFSFNMKFLKTFES